jgi:membrane protein YqaA with SNARE-associated domain
MNSVVPPRASAARVLRGWKAVLRAARNRKGLPVLVAAMAAVSSGTGLYPFMPVLVTAVAFAPSRWRAIYVAAVLGAAAGAGLLALAIQAAGEDLASIGIPRIGELPQWLEAEPLIRAYGDYALAMVAALPVPQIPVLLALALAHASPWSIAAAVLVGKAIKYGAYIAGTELIVAALRRFRRN